MASGAKYVDAGRCLAALSGGPGSAARLLPKVGNGLYRKMAFPDKKTDFFHHFLSHPIGLTALTTYNRGRFVLRTGAGHRILPGFFLWTIKKHD